MKFSIPSGSNRARSATSGVGKAAELVDEDGIAVELIAPIDSYELEGYCY